jgi:hypothetical protein
MAGIACDYEQQKASSPSSIQTEASSPPSHGRDRGLVFWSYPHHRSALRRPRYGSLLCMTGLEMHGGSEDQQLQRSLAVIVWFVDGVIRVR